MRKTFVNEKDEDPQVLRLRIQITNPVAVFLGLARRPRLEGGPMPGNSVPGNTNDRNSPVLRPQITGFFDESQETAVSVPSDASWS